jgi:hypothetical protein
MRRIYTVLIAGFGIIGLCHPNIALAARNDLGHTFADTPKEGISQPVCLPTPNVNLYEEGAVGFAARTRTNDEYGLPGWVRDGGGRFHKGVDILPVNFEKSDQTVRIDYYDPKTKQNFSENEPVLVPKDEVYAVFDGIVVIVNSNENKSGYGRYIQIQHKFNDGKPFVTMYAHLDQLKVKPGDQVKTGDILGVMGQTSSSPGGRSYLKAIPHCHFEVGRIIRDISTFFSPKLLFSRAFSGKFTTKNIQPFNPIEFLRNFHAQSKLQLMVRQTEPKILASGKS